MPYYLLYYWYSKKKEIIKMYEFEFINKITNEHDIRQSRYCKAPDLGPDWELVFTEYVEEY
jgi:hypothetical protein